MNFRVREPRRRLRELEAQREVLTRLDARAQALDHCLHCGATALVLWGETATQLDECKSAAGGAKICSME